MQRKLERGEIDADRAEQVRRFIQEGFLIFRLSLSDDFYRKLEKEIDRLWRERPIDLAYLWADEPRSMADASRKKRMATVRLLDPHSHSEQLERLYLHPTLFSWSELLIGEEPASFQSFYEEFGHSIPPLRDAVVSTGSPSGRQLSAWIALEEMTQEVGRPYVIPGSHRLPLFEFEPNRTTIQENEDYTPAHRFALSQAAEKGLSERTLQLERGEVLLRHPALIWGAKRVERAYRKRRLFTVRLAPRSEIVSREGSYWKTVRGSLWRKEKRHYWNRTENWIRRGPCAGLDNPLRGLSPRGTSLKEKMTSLWTKAD